MNGFVCRYNKLKTNKKRKGASYSSEWRWFRATNKSLCDSRSWFISEVLYMAIFLINKLYLETVYMELFVKENQKEYHIIKN